MSVVPRFAHAGLAVVYKADSKFIMVPSQITAYVVRNKHLAEISAGDFSWSSQDGFLSMINVSGVTGIVTSKGGGAGTVVTQEENTDVGIIQVEKLA